MSSYERLESKIQSAATSKRNKHHTHSVRLPTRIQSKHNTRILLFMFLAYVHITRTEFKFITKARIMGVCSMLVKLKQLKIRFIPFVFIK